MTDNSTREETFHHGGYLETLAELLVLNGDGEFTQNGIGGLYNFTHPDFKGLEIVTRHTDEIWKGESPEISLKGTRKQIRSFMNKADKRCWSGFDHDRIIVTKKRKREKGSNGDYLEAFAHHLVLHGQGKCERNDNGTYFIIGEPIYDLEIFIRNISAEFSDGPFYEITLEGSTLMIQLFMDGAKKREWVNWSTFSVRKQLREPKKYSDLMTNINSDQIEEFYERPIIRIEFGNSGKKPQGASIGYVYEDSLNKGVRLKRRVRERRGVIHHIGGFNYVPAGKVEGAALGVGYEKFKFYTLDTDDTVQEVIERIEDDRPVIIT